MEEDEEQEVYRIDVDLRLPSVLEVKAHESAKLLACYARYCCTVAQCLKCMQTDVRHVEQMLQSK